MVKYNKVNIKFIKLKTAVENQTGATLRMNIKMFSGNYLSHELILTTRLTTKLRNAN